MPIYDFECDSCKNEFELIETQEVNYTICPNCKKIAKRVFPKSPPKFTLLYNPKCDIVDWNGNKSRYWDEYKKMKEEGKKPRIPALDGD